jgi:hypothetical protein
VVAVEHKQTVVSMHPVGDLSEEGGGQAGAGRKPDVTEGDEGRVGADGVEDCRPVHPLGVRGRHDLRG